MICRRRETLCFPAPKRATRAGWARPPTAALPVYTHSKQSVQGIVLILAERPYPFFLWTQKRVTTHESVSAGRNTFRTAFVN